MSTSQYGALFDLDGVLIDSEGIYTDFWSEVSADYPDSCKIAGCNTPHEFALIIKGNTLQNILGTYFPETTDRAKIIQRLKHHELTMNYRVFDGTYELLEKLKQAGIPIAIVTSSNKIKMNHMSEQLPRLVSYATAIITGDDVTASKPDPQGYLKGAMAINRDPRLCWVFEDSLAGIEAGQRAGCRVIGVASTLNRQTIIDANPDIIVDLVAQFNIDNAIDLY
ncbi:MAG: HAD family phosphatase [Muribaculaceae bacterium]|nr:HAD family phosphatase [Muribaculaceae bacterium]